VKSDIGTSTDVIVKTKIETFDTIHVRSAKSKSGTAKSRIEKTDLESELRELIQKSKKASDVPDYDTIFEEAGKEKGVMIWSIVKLEPQELDKHLYGIFNTGDCYIVIFTHDSQDTENRPKSLYYWFGEKASYLKRCICCNIANYLTEKLENCKSYAQEEGQEMESFIKLFTRPIQRGKELTLCDETVKTLPVEKKGTKLIKITPECKSKRVRPFFDELSGENVYVALTPENIFLWVGKKCSLQQRIKGSDIIDIVRHEDKRGSFEEVVLVEEGKESDKFLQYIEKFRLVDKEKKAIADPDETFIWQVKINESKLLEITSVTQRPFSDKIRVVLLVW
jgi:hypothetical protein